jgi:hypothetical protein
MLDGIALLLLGVVSMPPKMGRGLVASLLVAYWAARQSISLVVYLKKIIRCLERQRRLHIARAAPRHLWSLSLSTMTVLLPVDMYALVWALRMAFGWRAHVPLVSLTASSGFSTLALMPWRASGQETG